MRSSPLSPEHGHTLLSQGQFESAAIAFTKTIYLQPTRASLYKGLASAFIGLGDIQSAIQALHRAELLAQDDGSIGPTLARLYGSVGRRLDADGDYALAQESYSEALSRDPDQIQLWMMKLRCLKRLGQYADAIDCISSWMPRLESGRFDEAISGAVRASLVVERARLNLILAQYTQAITDQSFAIELLPEDDDDLKTLIDLCRRTAEDLHAEAEAQALAGSETNAIECVSWAIQLAGPKADADHLRLRATIREESEKTEDRVAALDDLDQARSHEADPNRCTLIELDIARIHNDLAVSDLLRGDASSAIQRLHRAILLDNTRVEYFLNRADCFVQTNQLHHAKADYHEAIDLLKRSPESRGRRQTIPLSEIGIKLSFVHYRFGVDAFNRHALTEAASEFTYAIRMSGGHVAEYYAQRGITFEQLQEPGLAIADYVEVLRVEPDHDDATDRLSVLRGGSRSGLGFAEELGITFSLIPPAPAPSTRHQIWRRRQARLQR